MLTCFRFRDNILGVQPSAPVPRWPQLDDVLDGPNGSVRVVNTGSDALHGRFWTVEDTNKVRGNIDLEGLEAYTIA